MTVGGKTAPVTEVPKHHSFSSESAVYWEQSLTAEYK